MQKISRAGLGTALLTLISLFVLSFSLTLAQEDGPDLPEVCVEVTFTLWAGQGNNVGTVVISNDDENLYVTFNTSGGWLLEEAHVGVGPEFEDISDNDGGAPSPGQLPYKEEDIHADTFTFVIPLTWDPETDLFVVAHAAVYLPGDEGEILEEETAFGGGDEGPGNRWWYYMRYTVQECEPEEEPGGDGCTPGFWKNHPEVWFGHIETPINIVFDDLKDYPTFDDVTWLEALYLQGGPGVDGAIEILLRAAAAAALNAQYVNYELSSFQVAAQVNAALVSGDRDTILELAETLDGYNNGNCNFAEPGNGNGNNGNGNGADNGSGTDNGNGQEAKVTICHIPPGNPANPHQITVGASAVPAHLAHGDVLGECPSPPAEQNPPGNSGNTPNSNNGQGKGRP